MRASDTHDEIDSGDVGRGRAQGDAAECPLELRKDSSHGRNRPSRSRHNDSCTCARTAEVTVGGVDTRDLSSKTMEANDVPGLYFIGEAVDVTGHLGGFNFQWAWASGHACGEVV